jgi:hypothetical protein
VADEFIGGGTSAREALAAGIEADRDQILDAYTRALAQIDCLVVGEASARELAIADAAQALDDVTRSLRAGWSWPSTAS